MRGPTMFTVIRALLLLASGVGTTTVAAQTPAATGSGDLVVLDIYQRSGTEVVRFVNPESGRTWDWSLKDGECPAGMVGGLPGVVFTEITNGRSTEIYAVGAGSLSGTVTPKRIATVPGRSMVWTLSEDGSHLLVLTFPESLVIHAVCLRG